MVDPPDDARQSDALLACGDGIVGVGIHVDDVFDALDQAGANVTMGVEDYAFLRNVRRDGHRAGFRRLGERPTLEDV